MTQNELADLAKISIRAVQRVEGGERSPRGSTISAIAKALKCSIDELYRNPQIQNIDSKPPLEQAMLLTQAQLKALADEAAKSGVEAVIGAINKPTVPIYDDSARGKLHKFIEGLSDSEAKYLHMRAQAYVDEARSLASKKYTQYKDKKSK